jgi:CHASE2 domain-containing sensor protein
VAWAAAQAVHAPVTESNPARHRTFWLNYYGPPGTLKSVSYYQALKTNLVQPGFFADKIVFVGAKQSSDYTGKGKDEFATPFSRWGESYSPGTEIQATASGLSPPLWA